MKYLNDVFGLYEDFVKCLVEYEIYFDNTSERKNIVFYAEDFHLRAKVMLEMISNYPEIFCDFYSNIIKL